VAGTGGFSTFFNDVDWKITVKFIKERKFL